MSTKHSGSDIIITAARSGAYDLHNMFLLKLTESNVLISADQCIIN